MISEARQNVEKPRRSVRRLRRAVCAAIGLPVAGTLLFHGAVAWLPEGDRRPRPASTLVLDRTGVPLGAYAAVDGQWHLPLKKEEISPHLLSAIVAVEDARFYEHGGVDWLSVGGAMWENVRAMGVRRGASTISMQLARLRFGTSRSLAGKVEQAVRACQVERAGKEEILCEYLNCAPFGGNLVGAGAASWRYYGKPCAMLSMGEAALLAGLPQNPNRLRPDRHPEAAMRRRNHVLDRMLVTGVITPKQHAEAAAEPVNAMWRALPQNETAIAGANGLGPTMLYREELHGGTVETTIDAAVQRQVALAARAQLARLSGVNAAAVVVLDTATAECRALVSLGQTDLDLTRSRRSTGSALKPFIYAAAFEANLVQPESMVDDSPAAWPGYQPGNMDHRWQGKMTAAEALAQSRNIPALVLLSRLGVPYMVGVMQSAGLRSLADDPSRYGVSLAIGGAETSPVEMAQAYATLGRGGTFRPARLVAGTDAAVGTRCITEAACRQVLAACSMRERTARLSAAAARGRIAWKTGTSSGCRDAWCAAVTPRYTVVAWFGNTDGRAAEVLVGVEAAAPLVLDLIASLDGGQVADNPWATSVRAGGQASVPERHSNGAVTLVSPADRLQIVQDDRAEPLLLQARVSGAPAGPLWWFVDGELLGSGTEQIWWTPVRGSHRISVATADGRSASAIVQVR